MIWILLVTQLVWAQSRKEACLKINIGQLNRCSDMKEASIQGETVRFQADTRYGDFSKSRWSKVTPVGADFSFSSFRQLTVSRSTIRSCQFRQVDAVGAVFERIHFINSDLSGMDFSGAKLSHVRFTGSNLRGAKFVNAVLRFVEFEDSNLADADFSGAQTLGSPTISKR